MEELKNNIVHMAGDIVQSFVYSHTVYGEKFYEGELAIARNSGIVDYIPLMVSERLVDVSANWLGQRIIITGEFRSFNDHKDGKSRLKLYVFITDVDCTEHDFIETQNEIYLRAYICKEPVFRRTPVSERDIADFLVAVNRGYDKCDYIPCIAWGRNARYVSSLPVGTYLEIEGRVQSREYIKRYPDANEGEELEELRTAYEVSINKIEI